LGAKDDRLRRLRSATSTRTRTIHGVALDARTNHYDALRFDRLRRVFFRCTARLVVTDSILEWLITCDVILWCGRKIFVF
jgi:hypothetical protein